MCHVIYKPTAKTLFVNSIHTYRREALDNAVLPNGTLSHAKKTSRPKCNIFLWRIDDGIILKENDAECTYKLAINYIHTERVEIP
jgi:hypothetical protein